MSTAFTDTAHTALFESREEASRRNHAQVGAEHLFLGLIDAGGDAVKLLRKLGEDPDAANAEVEKQFSPKPNNSAAQDRLQHSPMLKNVFERAQEQASLYGQDRIGTEHLLLGILAEKDGCVVNVLQALGADLSDINPEF